MKYMEHYCLPMNSSKTVVMGRDNEGKEMTEDVQVWARAKDGSTAWTTVSPSTLETPVLYLGVMLDTDGSWKTQIESVDKLITQYCAIITKNQLNINHETYI